MSNIYLKCTIFGSILLGVFALQLPVHAQVAVPKDQVEIAAASEGYLSNLESFPNFNCRFIVSDYRVDTIADAVAGRFGSPTMVNEGLILVRGSKERYRLGCPPKVLAQTKEKGLEAARQSGKARVDVFIPCLEVNVLVNGRYKLDCSTLSAVADFYSSDDGPQPPQYSFLSPVTLGKMVPPVDPGTLLREVVDGKKYGRYEGMQKVNGHDAMVFVVGETAKRITDKFYLDSNHGFLPLRHDSINPENGVRGGFSFFKKFRACSGGRWYPEYGVTIINPEDEGRKPLITREVKVTSLDADNPPREEELAVVIPAGHQVKDPNNLQALYIEKADRHVTAESLPKLAEVIPSGGRKAQESGGRLAQEKYS